MPFTRPFLKLVLEGDLGDGAEHFSYGLHMVGSGFIPVDVPPAVLTACETFFAATSASNARLMTVKLNEIGTDGKYERDTTVRHDYPGAGIAGLGTPHHVFQVALVVSLLTTKARGHASKGRFYVPSPQAFGAAPNMTLTEGQSADVAIAATTFIESLNAVVTGFEVGLVSPIGAGAESVVTRVRVGSVLDTMRSRRTSLVEDYVEEPVTGA